MSKRMHSGLRLSGGQEKTDLMDDWTSLLNKEDRDFCRDVVVHKNVSGLGLTFSKEPPYKVRVGSSLCMSLVLSYVFSFMVSLSLAPVLDDPR